MRSLSQIETRDPNCKRCDGIGWVCENHPNVPWAGMTGEPFCRSGVEGCGGAGMPCPGCNALSTVTDAYQVLRQAGHSAAKAAEIVLDAERGERYAVRWVASLRSLKSPAEQLSILGPA